MGSISWLSQRAGRDLDQQVHGVTGSAQEPFPNLLDEADVVVRARISSGHHGEIVLHAICVTEEAPVQKNASAMDSLASNLGAGKLWRGGTVTVRSDPQTESPASDALAVLTVEVLQPDALQAEGAPVSLETFAVESRFDESGGSAPREPESKGFRRC